LGLTVIDQAVSALKAAGIKTRRAYPGAEMPVITKVVAAVQIFQADFLEKSIALEAKLLCPQSLGGSACEDAAITAAQALEEAGFSCTVGQLTFDGRTGLFCVSCIAGKQEQPEAVSVNIPLKLGSISQKRVVSFTAKRQTDEIITQLSDAPWKLRLEQFIPAGETEDRDPDGETFSLTYGSEKYTGCVWTFHSRVAEVDGIRQIREGTATGRTVSS